MILNGKPHSSVSRRDLIKGAALVAASAAVGSRGQMIPWLIMAKFRDWLTR